MRFFGHGNAPCLFHFKSGYGTDNKRIVQGLFPSLHRKRAGQRIHLTVRLLTNNTTPSRCIPAESAVVTDCRTSRGDAGSVVYWNRGMTRIAATFASMPSKLANQDATRCQEASHKKTPQVLAVINDKVIFHIKGGGKNRIGARLAFNINSRSACSLRERW